MTAVELRLFVDPTAPLIFVEPNDPPADNPNARPWLIYVSDLSIKARAGAYRGAFSNENASISVHLDNTAGKARERVGRPLRIRAEVWDGALLYFDGTTTTLDIGTALAMDVEA